MISSGRAFEHGTLKGATEALHDLLAELAKPLSLLDGQAVFEQGDPGSSVFAILSGQVEISVLSKDGRKLVLNVLRPGTVFGEIALFDEGPRTASAVAIGSVRLATVRRDTLVDAIHNDPGIAVELLKLAGKRLRWVSEQVEGFAFLPLQNRLARRLVYLAAQSEGPSSTVQISQGELAEHVGATREAVAKILSNWRQRGLVRVGRGWVQIADDESLAFLADGDF